MLHCGLARASLSVVTACSGSPLFFLTGKRGSPTAFMPGSPGGQPESFPQLATAAVPNRSARRVGIIWRNQVQLNRGRRNSARSPNWRAFSRRPRQFALRSSSRAAVTRVVTTNPAMQSSRKVRSSNSAPPVKFCLPARRRWSSATSCGCATPMAHSILKPRWLRCNIIRAQPS